MDRLYRTGLMTVLDHVLSSGRSTGNGMEGVRKVIIAAKELVRIFKRDKQNGLLLRSCLLQQESETCFISFLQPLQSLSKNLALVGGAWPSHEKRDGD